MGFNLLRDLQKAVHSPLLIVVITDLGKLLTLILRLFEQFNVILLRNLFRRYSSFLHHVLSQICELSLLVVNSLL